MFVRIQKGKHKESALFLCSTTSSRIVRQSAARHVRSVQHKRPFRVSLQDIKHLLLGQVSVSSFGHNFQQSTTTRTRGKRAIGAKRLNSASPCVSLVHQYRILEPINTASSCLSEILGVHYAQKSVRRIPRPLHYQWKHASNVSKIIVRNRLLPHINGCGNLSGVTNHLM